MPDFLKPYLAYIYVGVALALFGSGFYLGYKWKGNADLADRTEQAEQAVDRAGEQVDADAKAATDWAKKNTDADASAREIKMKGIIDAQRKALAQCRRDDISHRLLLDAIDNANGTAPTGLRMPDSMRPALEAGGPERRRLPSVGAGGS